MHTKDYLDKEPYEFVEVLEATPLQELLAPARHAHINEWQIPDRGVCHDRVHAAGVNFLLYTEDFERWECVVDMPVIRPSSKTTSTETRPSRNCTR
jgi:hypothetical protein